MDILVMLKNYIRGQLEYTTTSENSAEWIYEKGRWDAYTIVIRKIEEYEQQK